MVNRHILCLLTGLIIIGLAVAGCGLSAPKAELVPIIEATSEIPDESGKGAAEEAAEETAQPREEPANVVNILLLGVDSWDSLTGRSDAIVLVSVDIENEKVLLTSVPRDLRVNLEGQSGPQRINAAYAYGGAELARDTLEHVLDVTIPYYAVVNFTGFARVIDTLGGVTIDVPENIIDLEFPAVNSIDYEPFIILSGRHHFDGEVALKYARTRKSSLDGDFDRMYRQQQVMRALKAQALTPRTLLRLPTLYNEFRQSVDTNVSLEMMLRLAKLASSIDGDAISSYAIDEDTGLVAGQIVDGMFLLEPDLAGIRSAVHERMASLAEEGPPVATAAP
jgi:LCP family protein required for cell wall assembly